MSFIGLSAFRLCKTIPGYAVMRGAQECLPLLNSEAIGNIYGPEELVFGAPANRKDELGRHCYRIDEVRLYSRPVISCADVGVGRVIYLG